MTARRKLRAPTRPEGNPPAELTDPAHRLWTDSEAYRAYMSAHGWAMPAADRVGGVASARARHRRAVAGWAVATGAAAAPADPRHPDWRRLRELELIR